MNYNSAKPEEVAGEIADVMEVLFAIAKINGLNEMEIENTRQLKLQQRGGFNDRILLKSVSYQNERTRPLKKSKNEIPVNIYKGEDLVMECNSIQEAARWLKLDTGDKLKRYSAINNGIWYDEPYLCNGVTYYFLTDEVSLKERFDKDKKQKIKEIKMHCVFCNIANVVIENDLSLAFYDKYPVTEGHILIIPKRHTANYFELTKEELNSINELLLECKTILDDKFQPDGYNIGVNCGETAGQTVFHCHVHLIPRYKGDIENPRGGVKGVIPDKCIY